MDKILILDFGSQYTQLIARRVRESKVYCEIWPYSAKIEDIVAYKPQGIILSGGPASVYDAGAPLLGPQIFELNLPILGICYGMQLMGHLFQGEVARAPQREYGRAQLIIDDPAELLRGLNGELQVWMSHGDKLLRLPKGYKIIAHTANSPIAAIRHEQKPFYGVQFHPEVVHTSHGKEILQNFLYLVCKCRPSWTMASFVEQSVSEIRQKVGTDRVICALSGGVDSSVVAVLLHKAIEAQLTCIFVDNGLLRKGEAASVVKTFRDYFRISLDFVEAEDRFLEKLKGVTDPEKKRRIIGHEFIAIFEEEASKVEGAKFLAQGTLYPDVIESVSVFGPSATIKTHHNVGGLPIEMVLELIEPLRYLFKDEVRELGRELGLPEEIVQRQPFPGPGLAIRVVGEINRERLNTLREADAIVMEEIKKAGLYQEIWQAFAVLLPVKSVGVMGDERTYENVVALRAVTSQDGMTADWVQLPYELLGRIANRIINEVPRVNRVVYDISSKPPSTIEWE